MPNTDFVRSFDEVKRKEKSDVRKTPKRKTVPRKPKTSDRLGRKSIPKFTLLIEIYSKLAYVHVFWHENHSGC